MLSADSYSLWFWNFYCSNNKNSTNNFSKRFNYKKILSLKIILWSMLQNKSTLSLSEESLTQSVQKNSVELIFVSQLTKMSIKFDAELVQLTRNRRNILTKLVFIFKLIDIQIVISKKIINDVSDNLYDKLKRFMKFLI